MKWDFNGDSVKGGGGCLHGTNHAEVIQFNFNLLLPWSDGCYYIISLLNNKHTTPVHMHKYATEGLSPHWSVFIRVIVC